MVTSRDELDPTEHKKGVDIRHILLYIMITAFIVLLLFGNIWIA